VNSRLEESLDLIREDHQKVQEYIKLVESNMKTILESNQENTSKVNNTVGTSMDLPSEAPVQPALSDEEYDLFDIANGINIAKIQRLEDNELLINYEKKYQLYLAFGKGTEIIQKTFHSIQGVHVDEFYMGLVQSSEIDSLLKELHDTTQLPEVLREISIRMSTISDLIAEIAKVERSFTVHKKRQDKKNVLLVEFSSMQSWCKFFVGFELSGGYPYGSLNFTFKTLFGDASILEENVIKAVSSIPSGEGRLSKVCTAINKSLS